jgi:hypothetical protein
MGMKTLMVILAAAVVLAPPAYGMEVDLPWSGNVFNYIRRILGTD